MKKIAGNAQKAKLSALKEAHKMAKDMMGEDLKGLKKVTVAAPDKKGLEKGLETAESLISGSKMDDSKPFDESGMSDEEEAEAEDKESGDRMDGYIDPDSCESPEEIDALIAKLQEKKKAFKSSY